jgi:hypothetical protein
MSTYLSTVTLIAVLLVSSEAACHSAPASNLTGTWIFHVDFETGGSGHPVFVFKQQGDKLTGSYEGGLGRQEVTGSITRGTAVFGFRTARPVQRDFYLETITVTWAGTLESETKMSGTVEFTDGQKGTWTAERK